MQNTNKLDNKKCEIDNNPLYTEMKPYWEQMQDTVELGSKAVKEAGIEYLPMTAGQKADGDTGKKNYESYKTRSNYINFGKRTMKKADGLLNYKPYVIEVPKDMESVKTSATIDKESIEALIRITNKNQMMYSRYGHLVDFPRKVKIGYVPYIVKYSWDSIIDWHEEIDEIIDEKVLRFVLLDESGFEFDKKSKQHNEVEKYRLLGLAKYRNGVLLKKQVYYSVVLEPSEWNSWDIEDPDYDHENFTIPQLSGVKAKREIDYIPFTFVNLTNNNSSPEIPLLFDQSNLSLAYYRGDADYRHALFLQAFALLTLIGFTQEDLKNGVRADGYISSSGTQAKASYAQVSGQGLEQMRLSQIDLKNEAQREGVSISDKEGVESGKALSTRITMQTADLSDLAKTCGEAIKRDLTIIADWMGLDKESIKVVPNIDFNTETEDFRIITETWSVVKEGGMPLIDYYNILRENNFTKEQTFEDWDKTRNEDAKTFETVTEDITETEDSDIDEDQDMETDKDI